MFKGSSIFNKVLGKSFKSKKSNYSFSNPNISNSHKVSSSPSSLSKSKLFEIFEFMNSRLNEEGCYLELYVYGGSVITMIYNDSRTTQDVDSLLKTDDSLILNFILNEVREEFNLDRDWFNSEVKLPLAKLKKEEIIMFKSYSNLKVMVPSTKQLLAMKILASRQSPSKDFEDSILLCRNLDLKDKNEIKDVFLEFLDDEFLDDKRFKFIIKLSEVLFNDSR